MTWEQQVAEIVAWLRANKLQGHTSRGQTLIVKPRRPKRVRDRLGQWRPLWR
jgi:hypothetical protein